MKRSEDRILTSHTGSLHMPKELKELLLADFKEGWPGKPEMTERLRTEVANVVRKQVDLGIDVVNDGEFSKPTWCNYVIERISGFDLKRKDLEADHEFNLTEQQPESKDMNDFGEYYSEAGMSQMFYVEPGAAVEMMTEVEESDAVVTGPLV